MAGCGSNKKRIGAEEIDQETHPEEYIQFRDELTSFATELASLVVRDGEGATKFVTVTVEVRPSRDHIGLFILVLGSADV